MQAYKNVNILFVCTGNIFRSMAAEYCLRDYIDREKLGSIFVSSAGTIAHPEPPHPKTIETLASFGIDATPHVQTKLTREVLEKHDIIIAMAKYHQEFIKANFGLDAPLYNEAIFGESTSVPDIDESVPDHRTNPEAEEKHVVKTVEYIHKTTPPLFVSLWEKYTNKFI